MTAITPMAHYHHGMTSLAKPLAILRTVCLRWPYLVFSVKDTAERQTVILWPFSVALVNQEGYL